MAKQNVEVLLRDHVKSLGRCGDVVKVSLGYARNYLLPRRIAVEASEDNKRAMVRRRAILDLEESQRAAEIQARIAAFAGVVLKTTVKADEAGHLFGSVNAAAISELLRKQGHEVEEKAVRMDGPIKIVGTHKVKIHVHGEEHAEITVEVEKEATA
jgi:large subunit ribosomal protein L9